MSETLSDKRIWKNVTFNRRERFYHEENVKEKIQSVQRRVCWDSAINLTEEGEERLKQIFKEEFGDKLKEKKA